MKPEQTIVVEWMQRQLEKHKWSAVEWARAAQISPTTITRAMQPDYNSVTTIVVLDKLARAAGTESVLEFLART